METTMAQYRKAVRVVYSIKDEKGFIEEKRMKFDSLQEAMIFLKTLKNSCNVYGKPILEEK